MLAKGPDSLSYSIAIKTASFTFPDHSCKHQWLYLSTNDSENLIMFAVSNLHSLRKSLMSAECVAL
jgi:hypothetical protein